MNKKFILKKYIFEVMNNNEINSLSKIAETHNIKQNSYTKIIK